MKVGLKETLSLLAAGYKKKDIDAMIAADEEDKKEEQPADPSENKAPDPNPGQAQGEDKEPDYKAMYEELQTKNKELEETVTKLQQSNVNKDSSKDIDEHKREQSESLTTLVRSFM